MFNVTVIKLKDVKKYLLALILIAIAIWGVKRYFFDRKLFDLDNIKIGESLESLFSSHVVEPINIEMPVISAINEKEENVIDDENKDNSDEEFMTQVFQRIIGTELGVVDSIMNTNDGNTEKKVAVDEEIQNTISEENSESMSNESEDSNNISNDALDEIEPAKTDVQTEVVTKNPLIDKSTNNYKGVKIKNESKNELTEEILNPEGLKIDKSNVIIFHTHTCESYTSSEKYSYTPTGNFRTTDLNYSVARVGDELSRYLEGYGINVTHNKTYHDYPSYTGSYTRSLSTVSKILENIKADIIIDLHRDAIGSYSSYAPTVKIGDDYCAQLMFVMGTNGGGLNHPNWQQNLKWAVSVQQKANEVYPGLFKTMIVRNSRYNQQLGKAACIIEVGATGNTLEECLNSMKYLAAVINNN